MIWDVEEEHNQIYNEDESGFINEITDCFDDLIEMIHKNTYWYAGYIVDVFPCKDDPLKSVYDCLQRYFSIFCYNVDGEKVECSKDMLIARKVEKTTISKALFDTFSYELFDTLPELYTGIYKAASKYAYYIKHNLRTSYTGIEKEYVQEINRLSKYLIEKFNVDNGEELELNEQTKATVYTLDKDSISVLKEHYFLIIDEPVIIHFGGYCILVMFGTSE